MTDVHNALGNARWSISYALDMLPPSSPAREALRQARDSIDRAGIALVKENSDAPQRLV